MPSLRKILGGFFVVSLALAGPHRSFADDGPNARADSFIKKIQEAHEAHKNTTRSLWMARYIGEITKNDKCTRSLQEIKKYLDDDPGTYPGNALNKKYSDSFKEWFGDRARMQWAVPDGRVIVWDNAVELSAGGVTQSEGYAATYFISVYASPRMQGWYLQDNPEILAVSSSDPEPSIHSGRIFETAIMYFNNISLKLDNRPLHSIWIPKFVDLDGDKIPEVFIRYNTVDDNGFQQELAIYKFVEFHLEFYKKFIGKNGGIARMLDKNKIQIGDGDPNNEVMHLETWEYKNGSFEVSKTETIPNPFLTDAWKDYYFQNEEPFNPDR